MKSKKTRSIAAAAALVMAVSAMGLPAYAYDEFDEFGYDEAVVDGDAVAYEEVPEDISAYMAVDTATSSYSTAQKAAYNYITAACTEFVNSNVNLSTDAFKIVTLDSALTVTEIGQVISDIKASGSYPVLGRIGLYSSANNSNFDKVTLFTESEYRTAAGREPLKIVQKPDIANLAAGDGQVTVTWSAVSTAKTYRVFTYINGKYTKVADTTSTSYTVKNLTNGTNYGFLVLSSDDGVKYSKFTTADVKYATPEAAATKPVITNLAAGDGQVTVTWSAVSTAKTYRVFTYINGKYTKVADTTSTSYTVKNLTNGTNYGFLVLSSDDGVKYSKFTTADVKYATPEAK